MGKLHQTADSFESIGHGSQPDEQFGRSPKRKKRLHNIDWVSSQPQSDDESDSEQSASSDSEQSNIPACGQGHLAVDSYGKLRQVGSTWMSPDVSTDCLYRFLGGTSNKILIEAVQSLDNSSHREATIELGPSTPGSSISRSSTSVPELPFFVGNVQWPPLPWLPRAQDVSRPHQFVSDILVDLYFEQLHYTFPALYKPSFMQQYRQWLSSSESSQVDAGFLSVFFAVCACSSGLLPRDAAQQLRFPGLEYYQKALVIHYSTTGQASLETVQCLALLALCTAGWNTLTQSWKFAGQAVRAAQDLGLHANLHPEPSPEMQAAVTEQIARRVWWSVYGLDRLISVCLGRPMAVDDDDCTCELPSNLADDQIGKVEKHNDENRDSTLSTNLPMTGFIVFSKLCRIAGQIVRSSRTLQRLRHSKSVSRVKEARKRMRRLDKDLSKWLQQLPDTIKFSANKPDADHRIHLTMCVITFILHAGSIINLQGPFLPDRADTANEAASPTHGKEPPSAQCIHAARSCIQTGELILSSIPPSHYLAFCVNQLALAGIVLLRTSANPPAQDIIDDVQSCIRQLANLESMWSGAERSKLILQQLLSSACGDGSDTSLAAELFPDGMDMSFLLGSGTLMDFGSA